jgi:ABC-type branched-subunit amino acid transport system substrate-binding protein
MRSKRTAVWLACAAALAAVIVPVALGSSSAKPTVKFGIIVPEKAPFFDDTQSLGAANAALHAINARGGFNGVKGQLIFCNEKNDPNVASACARQMVAAHVAAVVGGVMLSGAPVNAILAAAKIPQIGIYPTTGQEYNAKNVYLLGGQGAYDWQVATAYAAHQGVKLQFTGNDNAASTTSEPILNKIAAQSGKGNGFVNKVILPATVADYSPLVLSAEQGGATGSVVYLDPDGNGKQFMLAAEQAHAPFKLYVRVGSDLGLAQSLGSAATKIVDAGPFPMVAGKALIKNALLQRFFKELAIEVKRGDPNANASDQRTSSLGTWLGYYVVEKLAKSIRSGHLNAATLTAALNKAKNIDMGGVIPPWTPTKPGPAGYSRVSNPYMYLQSFTASGQPRLLVKKPLTVAQAISGKY